MGRPRLREVRSAKGYTMATLADAVTEAGHRVSESTIAMIERGQRKPSLELAAAIAGVLGESIESLFLEIDSTKSAPRPMPPRQVVHQHGIR